MATIRPIPLEAALPLVEDLRSFEQRTAAFLLKSGRSPVPGSIAEAELKSFSEPDHVKTAYSQGNLLLSSATDHVNAFTRVVQPPINNFAAWTLVRGAVEPAAMAAWLYDPSINVTERVRRSYAYRFDSIDQERKLIEALGHTDLAQKSMDRLDFVEKEAVSLGYARVANRQRQRTGIGMVMPSNTAVIQQVFGEETQYRILSGMAHSLPYATTKLACRPAGSESELPENQSPFHDNMVAMEQHMSGASLGMLCHWVLFAMAKAVWFYATLYGFNQSELTNVLDETTRRLIKQPERRFWRTN